MADEISPDELAALQERGDAVRVVDIRAKLHFDRGHIPGSEHMPLHSLSEFVPDLADADTVVTVCDHGEASRHAISLIRSYEGIDDETRVASLAGGLDAWDGPLESSE